MNTNDETCDLCGEKVDYCCCLRCMTCEQLFLNTEEYESDDDGQPLCIRCAPPMVGPI